MKQQKQKFDLSIIIVSFNTREILMSCISSVMRTKTKRDQWEVMVVDNASTDGSLEMVRKEFPSVRCIKNLTNKGFAVANNQGIAQAEGKYILLLNSDTEVKTTTISGMLAFMDDHPEAGASTPKILLTNGQMDMACHRGFPTPWAAFTYFTGLERFAPTSRLFGQYHALFNDMTKPHEIDCPSGAFFLLRREVIDAVGFFDEQFFMYGEDIDYAYRMKERGWKIFFNPHEEIIHRKNQSGRLHENPGIQKQTDTYFYDTMAKFYTKHYQSRYSFLTTRVVLFGIAIRSRISTL
ncbi:MAG: glycosyltransferase family 2 protein [bacterium]|nr:glycosyltransferase family 2 protein [bacterium]